MRRGGIVPGQERQCSFAFLFLYRKVRFLANHWTRIARTEAGIQIERHRFRRSSRIQRHTDRKNRRNHADQISRGLRKIQRDIWDNRGNCKRILDIGWGGDVVMRTIGNILWFIFGGLLGGLAWVFAGCIWCITIIGIPVGLQCFKFATLAFWPFGKEIVYGNGMFSFLVNLIWIIFFGWEMALGNLIVGCIWCITIVGIPFGKQFFKMARLSFMPFGASVIG